MKSNTFTELNGSGLRIAIVAARFNQELTDALLDDCVAGLTAANVADDNIAVVRVPGSFELPVVASNLVAQDEFDAVICLGVIIKGETRHDEFIANAVAQGLTDIAVESGVPVIFGVVTTEDKAQADARSLGGKKKGWESAMTAVEMALLFQGE